MSRGKQATLFATHGIVDLAHLSTIAISGDNSKKFLQGQLTCDVNLIAPAQASIGSYCNIQGRVLCVFHLFEYDHVHYMLMPKELISTIATTLNKYGQFSRVNIDTTSPFHVYGLMGDAAIQFATAQQLELPNTMGAITQNSEFLIIRYPGTNPRWLCLNKTSHHISCDQPLASWQAQDILLGLPEIHTATSAHFTLHMLNLKAFNAVSFTKGCYLGQEIIARTEHLGKAKRGLYWSEAAQPEPDGTPIFIDNNEVGTLINSATIDQQHALLLAVLNNDITCSTWTPISS